MRTRRQRYSTRARGDPRGDPYRAVKTPPLIVSACLVGLDTRHDGRSSLCKAVLGLLKGHAFIPVCPEQLGGLPTPRPRAEIRECDGFEVMARGSSVIDENGGGGTPDVL